jgi:uncharacterized protein DUF6932
MRPLPAFTNAGDLPPDVYRASWQEVIDRFGTGSHRRLTIASRLTRIYAVAMQTGQVRRFIVFGSFITDKPEPNDVDVFLLMEDAFEIRRLEGEARLLFDHAAADVRFGASVFWLRPQTALGGEEASIEHWQIKRDGTRRGIIEVVEEAP